MSGPVRFWSPPLRDLATRHRVSGYPGRRPIRSRSLPGPASGLAGWRLWRARVVFWLAELAMRAAAREMARLPSECLDQTEPDPDAGRLDGCTCGAPAGSHRPGCIWAVAR